MDDLLNPDPSPGDDGFAAGVVSAWPSGGTAESVRELVGSLDVLANVAELAQLVVPFLGSCSIVSVVDEKGKVHDVGSWSAESALRDDVEAFPGSAWTASWGSRSSRRSPARARR